MQDPRPTGQNDGNVGIWQSQMKQPFQGIAAAVATAGAPLPSAPGKFTWQFRGSTLPGVDLQCKLLHLGQHNFRGDLAESLKLQNRW